MSQEKSSPEHLESDIFQDMGLVDSLHNVILDRLANLYKWEAHQELLCRVLFATEFQEGVPAESVQGFFDALMRQGDFVTGFLILYPHTFLHLIEGPWKPVLQILRQVQEKSSGPNALFSNTKILSFSEDIYPRYLNLWLTKEVSLPAPQSSIENITRPEDAEIGIHQSFAVFRSMGLEASKLKGRDLASFLEKLRQNFGAKLPYNEQVSGWLQNGRIIDIDEFLDLFDSDPIVELDQEIAWPLAAPIKYLQST